MQFFILGPVQLQVDGCKIPLHTIKVRGLLAILLLSPNTLITADTIVSRLWDDDHIRYLTTGARTSQPDRRKALQIHVTRLRKVFKRAGVAANVVNDQKAYRLEVDPTHIDYHRFRRSAADGRHAVRAGDHQRAVVALRTAIEMWHGVPFADLTTSWAQQQREILTQEYVRACCQLAESLRALDHHDQAVELLEPLIAEYSVDESLAAQWMQAKTAADGPASLPGYFRTFTERLRTDMSTAPSNHLIALYEQLIQTGSADTALARVARRITAPDQLPRSTPYFAGRHDVLAQLNELLPQGSSSAPLIAIDGPPGIGKTALIVEWANSHRDQFPDGQFFIDLSGHGPSEAVAATTVLASFLTALNIPAERIPSERNDRAALLRSILRNRRTLIVLDNARDSEHVRPVLAATASATVIVTSRQQLTGLVLQDGASRIVLTKLRPSESVALLANRLGTVRARPDSPAIRDLAELCDGMPLGLNIAAQYVAVSPNSPLKHLVETLRQQPPLLLDAGTHGDDGANSLRIVFSWSYGALRPDVRLMFTLLGWHPTPHVSVGAAAALAGTSVADAARTLDRLQGAHLLDQEMPHRFRFHDLIFLFARALAADVAADTRLAAIHRLLSWYLATITNAVRCLSPGGHEVPSLPMATEVVPDDFDNAEEASRWCVDERANLEAVARLAAETGLHDQAWRLIGRVDSVLSRYGSPAELIEIHQVGLASARACHSLEGEAGMLNSLGHLHQLLEDYEEAGRYFEDARTQFSQLGDSYGEAVSLLNTATSAMERGHFQTAIDRCQSAMTLFDEFNDLEGRKSARKRLGDVYRKMGRTAMASKFYDAALALGEEGNQDGQVDILTAIILTAIGELHLEMDEPAVAIQFCEKALSLHRIYALDEQREADVFRILSDAYLRVQRPFESMAFAKRAVERYASIGNRRRRAQSLDLLGRAHAATGRTAEGRAAWAAAIAWYDELGDPAGDDVRRAIAGLDVRPAPSQGQRNPPSDVLSTPHPDIT